MMKLTVEVLTAHDLLPTDDHGSPSPFVEVDFEGYRQHTQTKTRDLYPSWNEKLVFDIRNPQTLHKSIIQVILYDDRCANHHKDFLGCVQISGKSVSLLESEAAVQRYPLCNRGFFSHGRGDISLRIYVVRAQYYGNQQQRHRLNNTSKAPKLEEISDHDYDMYKGGDKEIGEDTEIMNFHSAGTRAGAKPGTKVERGRNFMNAETANEEENSSVNCLYVKVVKAKDLPVTGNPGPYVEVKFGEHKGVTNHIAKNEPLVWNEVFAFYSNELERNLVEVVVKDFGIDVFLGSIVVFDTAPFRFQGESPMTPQWHRLKNREGDTVTGEIMIAVWMGAQSDNTFPADSHDIIAHQNLTNTSPSVYFSPTLYYLRVGVIEAQHLVPSDKNQPPEFRIQIKLRNQVLRTRTSKVLDGNPVWNEDIIFVASEPFDDSLNINAVERYPRKQIIGWATLPLSSIPQRFDSTEHVQARWFNLGVNSNRGSNEKKQGKIILKLSWETGYHVSDSHQGDFQPTARHLKKDKIGGLEMAILGAQGLPPMKMQRDGRATTNAYCVAKYGNKWVRTTTSINSQDPCWNEHYDWEVYDPCTIIVIGVFDDGNVSGSRKDQRISKVLIPLQTLEMNRTYTQNYPLLVLHPSGLKNHGRLQVAIRFTGLSWPNIVSIYTKPLLPKMNYLQPLNMVQLEVLRYWAMERVAACLSNAEPPLKKEVVEYMLDVRSHL